MVGILLSTYNGEKYLRKQLDSLLAQDYHDWKCLIRDDGSQDNTVQVLEEYRKSYEDKFIFYNDGLGNVGWRESYSRLVNLSLEYDFEYILFCDQDDVWHRDKISVMLNYAREKDICLLFSDMEIMDEEDNIIEKKFFNLVKIKPEKLTWKKMIMRNIIPGMSMMINMESVKKLSPIPKGLAHDWWFSTSVYLLFNAEFISRNLCAYRLHKGNTCGLKDPINAILYYMRNISEAKEVVREMHLFMNSLIDRFGEELPSRERRILKRITNSNPILRKYFALYYDILPQSFIRKIGYLFVL